MVGAVLAVAGWAVSGSPGLVLRAYELMKPARSYSTDGVGRFLEKLAGGKRRVVLGYRRDSRDALSGWLPEGFPAGQRKASWRGELHARPMRNRTHYS